MTEPSRSAAAGPLAGLLVALIAVAAFCLAAAAPLRAQQAGEEKTAAPPAAESAAPAPEQPTSLTEHEIRIGDETLRYTASAGTIDIEVAGGKARGRLFYVAYTRAGLTTGERPLTFVFNGGPGASAAYLHLLAFGPRIVELPDDGAIPAPPVRLVDNAATWLTFTDLVFVDPVGTGYSRAISARNGAEADGKESRFWSFERDLDGIAEFIRLYLTHMDRWISPKFLAGESYGGFRAAALPGRLASEPGVRLNGIVLISPVLEFSLQQLDAYSVLPWAVLLPSYAATAHHYGKTAPSDQPLEALLGAVEAFALDEYLVWLAGAQAPGTDTEQTLADFVGLSREMVARHHGRISRGVFAKNLLAGSDHIVSLYDGTVTGVDPHPASTRLRASDPVLRGLTAPLNTAFVSYAQQELKFRSELPYHVLNRQVSRNWNWGAGGGRTAPGTADELKEAMSMNEELTVFVAHGLHDLVTPYFANKFVIRQMRLDAKIAANLTFRTYRGGHMLYTHAATRQALHRDARAFYERAVRQMPD